MLKTKNKKERKVPIWPMNAVSTREAIGSAVKARAAGNAIDAISKPSLSKLRTHLHIKERESKH